MGQFSTQELVSLFCQQSHLVESLIYIPTSDVFYQYQDKGYFKLLKPLDVEKMVYEFLILNIKKNISTAMIKDFINQIKYRIYRTLPDTATEYVALNYGKTLDLESFGICKSGPDKPAFYHIDCDAEVLDSHDGQPPTLFKQFLDEVLVDQDMKPDPELQMLVQEMMGYYLLNTLEAHATFFLVGDGQNGKSVFLNILREMVGEEFSSALSIEQLTTSEFAAAGLVGKKINICLEEESAYIKSDKFKAMVSGDPISVRRLYEGHFLWKPTVKHIFATNKIPSFSDINFGLIRRIKIIPFNKMIEEDKKDTQLTKKLLGELSGILAWAIEGAKRLKANNFKFSEAKQSVAKLEEFRENISAAVLFFKERYEKGTEVHFISNDQMYEEYKVWADNRGKKKQSYYVFLRDIEVITKLKDVNGRDDEGKTVKGKRIRYKDDLKLALKQGEIPM